MRDGAGREPGADRRRHAAGARKEGNHTARLTAWLQRLLNPRPSDLWVMEPDGRLCRVERRG